jgi:hypothetical protein
MMNVKVQHQLQPTVLPAHSVIVEDSEGNPIFVAVCLDPKTIICARADEPDFHALLRNLGIDKTVIVKQEKVKPIEQVVWTP